MRLAVISDIHGNSFALEAVLADIRRQAPDVIVNLGDVLASPVDPRATMDLLWGRDILTVRGNHDRWMIEQPIGQQSRVDAYASSQITDAHRQWLAALPPTAALDDVFICHGTPANDEGLWLDAYWHARATTLPSESHVEANAAGIAQSLMLCGHTHIPRAVRLRDGRQIVNPGSVGLQIVRGSPDARYAILDRLDGAWSASIRIVAYDHRAAAERARANGFPQWHEALATGWADPDGLF